MPHQIRPQPGIMDIALYQGGTAKIAGREDALKLSSNENPFGAGELAREAYRRAGHDLHRYPSTDHAGLRAALAASYGLDAARIICGVGSDEVITFLCQGFAGPGDEVLYSQHGFLMYPISAMAAGATPVKAPERDRTTDIDALLDAVTDRTKLVFVANPNNPTGTFVPLSELERLADSLPPQTLLVLDGAYAEYVDGYDGGAALVDTRENVVMTRTFSKLHGLGGLRIGWGYGPAHVMDVLNRLRGPFNLSNTQLDVAEAALGDAAHITRSLSENARLRGWLAEKLSAAGVATDQSFANFVLARFDTPAQATACNAALLADGLIVRQVSSYGLPEALRITVGDESACRRVAHSITRFMEGKG
ncbi:Histidinol-phosphate aminotransferase [Roseibaca ekhonensis]|jgi:histidinol-phosphate aminotransferase|uniref:Histidinol-phosphate aminotransferase n=1 Tax=Roseinatronobacter ekhonensis TaxID=254356 RepID=A0A3B0MNR5_9RHOB|nr:histidinol-phosphate transaminase [Roseibaca ekhonensis]SUZ31249.1 Histidinol-phosphate aminotransferase [Roseibaca ekhonensis]